MSRKDIRRFEIWLARDCFGKDGYRPVIVLSDDAESRTVTVIPLTSDRESTQLATHIILSGHGLAVPEPAPCASSCGLSAGTRSFAAWAMCMSRSSGSRSPTPQQPTSDC